MKADEDIVKLLGEVTDGNPVVPAAPAPGSPAESSAQQELRRDLHLLTRALREGAPLFLADQEHQAEQDEAEVPSDAEIERMMVAVRAERPGLVAREDAAAVARVRTSWARPAFKYLAMAATVSLGLFLAALVLRQGRVERSTPTVGHHGTKFIDDVGGQNPDGKPGIFRGVQDVPAQSGLPVDRLWGDERQTVAVLFDPDRSAQIMREGKAQPPRSVALLVPGVHDVIVQESVGLTPVVVYARAVYRLPRSGTFHVGATSLDPSGGQAQAPVEMRPMSPPLMPPSDWFRFLNSPEPTQTPPGTQSTPSSTTILAPRGPTGSVAPRIQTNGGGVNVYEVRLLSQEGAELRPWTAMPSWWADWDQSGLGRLSWGMTYGLEVRERGSTTANAASATFSTLPEDMATELETLLAEVDRLAGDGTVLDHYLRAVRFAQAGCCAEARLQAVEALQASGKSYGEQPALFLALIAAMYEKMGIPDSAAQCRRAMTKAIP
jgi:hypothetical protein